MTLIGVFVTQGVTLGVVNDVFNDVGTTGLVTCHAALGQQRCAVLSSRVGNVAVTGLWSTVLVLHCSWLSAHLAGTFCAACPPVLRAHDDPDVRCLRNMSACIGNTRA
jgi:hypothetical protein